ncbi:hypothetical protein A3F38_02390 [Candidatus Saccharibacteria bacterium RIFCSPHIGHO2_12_FULL_48_21]|nr:MAG: hypothetical protein A3F38_02390 [Candidatus Saccharibacteria bacterium RIFCSPHIGHO2_12_FULL_48_21]
MCQKHWQSFGFAESRPMRRDTHALKKPDLLLFLLQVRSIFWFIWLFGIFGQASSVSSTK